MKDKFDFTTGSIPKKMLKFMLPILFALILQAMYSAVDLLIVGKFGTTTGISAVTTGSNIMNLVTYSMAGLVTGVTVLMGQYIGEKKFERIGKLLGSAVLFFLVLGGVLTVCLIVFARPLAIIMQAPEEALDLTVLYIRICGVGYLFIVFYNFISSIFRGMGDSNLPMLFVGIACVVNIVGDLILVGGFHMNVAGAAIATVGAQGVSVVLSLVIIRKKKFPFSIQKEDLRFSEYIKRFVKVGAPLSLQDLLTNISFMGICAFINRIGLDASAGYGVAQKLQLFIMLIPSALLQSMASFVAQNVGAAQEDRAKKSMYFGMIFGVCVGIVMMLIISLKGDAVSMLFTNDPAVIARAFEFLKGFAPDCVITCILFSFMGYFNGHSKSTVVMVSGLVQSLLIRLPMSYFMSIRPDASLTGVGAAAPVATCIGIAICFINYRIYQKQLKYNNMI